MAFSMPALFSERPFIGGVILWLLLGCSNFSFGHDVNFMCSSWRCSLYGNNVFNIDSPNEGLTGQFPRCLANCSGVTHLDLSGNKIQGPLPPDLCSTFIPYITYLDLSNNSFWGQIPDVSNCSWLHTLLLQNNNFSGTIPPQLGLLPRLKMFNVSNNLLSGPVPQFAYDPDLIGAGSYANNSGLCGQPLEPCRSSQTKSNSLVRVLKSNSVIMVAAVGFGIGFVFSSSFFLLNPEEFPLCGLYI